jgi:hypothetical protein
MDRACNTHRGEEKYIYFGGETRRNETHLDIGGRIILKFTLEE